MIEVLFSLAFFSPRYFQAVLTGSNQMEIGNGYLEWIKTKKQKKKLKRNGDRRLVVS